MCRFILLSPSIENFFISDYSLYIASLYLFTVGAALYSRFLNVNIGDRLAITIASVTFVVAAFRPSYFPDVGTYEVMYDVAAVGEFSNALYWAQHGEPGFKVLSYLISLSGFGFSGFLLMMSCMSGLLLFLISRISGVPFSYLWFTYFSFYFITRDLGVMRLSIASHLIVIFLVHNAFIWRVAAIIIASVSFQYTAFIVVFVKLISRFKVDFFSVSLLFLIS